jgi:hypothetical protein
MESKTTFKSQSTKIAFSSNTPEGCANCGNYREPGSPALSVCGACQGLRYCSRQCQIAHWKVHKESCRISQQVRRAIADQPNGPAVETLLRNIEDFVRLHTPVFRRILATAISHSPSFDFRKKFVQVLLGKSALEKPDKGNPARAFFVKSANFVNMPGPGDHESYGKQLTAMRPAAERFEEKECGAEGYLGLLMCRYQVEAYQWIIPLTLHFSDINTIVSPETWQNELRLWSGRGIVFRTIDGKEKEGVMVKVKSKWVWKEHTSLEGMDEATVESIVTKLQTLTAKRRLTGTT